MYYTSIYVFTSTRRTRTREIYIIFGCVLNMSKRASLSSSSSSSEPQVKRAKAAASSPSKEELPLLLPKAKATKTMLVQLDDSAIDMQGDAGTVGRLRVGSDSRVTLDLNGKKLRGSIFPSVSCMVVMIGKTEAKVTSFTNEVCVVTSQTDSLKALRGEAEEGPAASADADSSA